MSVNLVNPLTRLTGLTELERNSEPTFTRQMAVKQEYSIGFAHAIEQAAIGFVNLVKGLTRLTRLPTAAVLYPSIISLRSLTAPPARGALTGLTAAAGKT